MSVGKGNQSIIFHSHTNIEKTTQENCDEPNLNQHNTAEQNQGLKVKLTMKELMNTVHLSVSDFKDFIQSRLNLVNFIEFTKRLFCG